MKTLIFVCMHNKVIRELKLFTIGRLLGINQKNSLCLVELKNILFFRLKKLFFAFSSANQSPVEKCWLHSLSPLSNYFLSSSHRTLKDTLNGEQSRVKTEKTYLTSTGLCLTLVGL